MINEEQVDKSDKGNPHLDYERELLRHKPDELREFYSLSGPARKDYIIQMAEAEAERIKILRAAEAEGILMIRKAEAEGYKLIGEALATVQTPDLVVKLAGLRALQQVAQSLGDGRATKIFVPQSMGDIFSLIGGMQETHTSAKGAGPAPTQ